MLTRTTTRTNTKTKPISLAAVAALLMFPRPTAAQPAEDVGGALPVADPGAPPPIEGLSLEQLLDAEVETPSLRRMRMASAPSTVSVLNREDLRRFGFLNVSEAVNSVVGMDVLHAFTVKHVPTARGILEGLYANKVLIMLNGIPTWQSITADGILNRVSMNDVERIEVVRGPVSVLYGTNAYSGAVNIVLRRPGSGESSAHARVGDHNLWDGGATVSATVGPVLVMVSASGYFERRRKYEFTGVDDFTFFFREQEQANNFTAIASWGGHQLMFNRFFFSHPSYGAQTKWDGGAGPLDNRGYLGAYKYERTFARAKVIATATYDQHMRNFLRGPPDRRVMLYSENVRAAGTLKGYYDVSDWLGVELGGEYDYRLGVRWEDMSSLDNLVVAEYGIRDVSVWETSAMAQATARLEPVTLLVGARATKNELYDNNVSGRATLTYALGASHSLRLIAGQSFRSPSIFELNYISREVVGNRDLVPERASSIELVHALGRRSLFVQTAAYVAKHADVIQRVAQPGVLQRKYANVSSYNGAGLEIEARYDHPFWGAGFLGYAFTRGVGNDRALRSSKDYNYRYVPDHTLKAGAGREWGAFRAAANGQVMSGVNGHLAPIGAQHFLDLHLGWSHRSKAVFLRHTVSAKNVTGSRMLTPEYIRQYPNINALETMGFGRRFVYSLTVDF